MIDGLRHFLLILEHGTFTEAARHAHLSQPALTASIRRLEEDLGATLLQRGRRGASPTAAGEALVPRAQAVLGAVDDARRAVHAVLGLDHGEVRIAAGGTACTYLLPPSLAAFRAHHPGIQLRLWEMSTEEAQAAVRASEVDLAVITDPEGEAWMVDELILVRHPGREGDPVFVSFRPGTTSRELLDRHFPGAEVVMELGSIAAVKSHVAIGVGRALVSRKAVELELADGRLVEVRSGVTPVRRPLHLVHRGVEQLSPAAAALRELLLG